MLLKTNQNDLINTDAIARLREKGRDVTAELRDGKIVTLARGFGVNLDTIEQATHQVIPARPGFALLTAVENDGRIEVERQDVIGWRLTLHGVEPVVLEGDVNESAILYPDGRVSGSASVGRVYPDEATWLAEETKRLKAQKKTDLKLITRNEGPPAGLIAGT